MNGATHVHVHVADDRLTVWVDCVVEPEEEDAAVADIVAQCDALRIDPTVLADDVKPLLHAALADGPTLANLAILTGVPPTLPVNGSIEWQREFFISPFVEDPQTGQMDYRQQRDRSIVAHGDLLATLVPPIPGTPGRNVFGKPVAVAKPFVPKIRAGVGVEFDEAANTFVAAIDGRVRFAQGVVSVDQTYTITGSVGLKTGNVSHPGSVHVAKDVQPDSRLEAAGSIHIAGVIDESIVISGGDILVGRGIIGGNKAKVNAAGSIEAQFAENADLVAEHDIRIRRALVQCTVHTQGTLHIANGQIIGGIASAVGGIDLGQAGSHGDVPTLLTAGVDAKLQERIVAVRAEAEKLHEQVARLRETVAPLNARQSSLPPQLREKLAALLTDLQAIEDRRIHTDQELEQLFQESKDHAKAEIRIHQKVFPDTRICIAHAKLTVTEEMDGPLVAKLTEDGDLVLEREAEP